jgi:hypothetical protein
MQLVYGHQVRCSSTVEVNYGLDEGRWQDPKQ